MATVYWLGAAVKTPGIKYFAVAGTWAEGDTAYIEINGKRLTLTIGTTVTAAQIVQDIAAMINGDSANDDETRSALGSSVGEFAILTATYDASNGYVILTGQSDGRPIGTVTVGEATVGDGTFAQASGGSLDTTDTGPHHFTDADNWSGGSVPSNTDDIVYDSQAASACLYDLSNGSLTTGSLVITDGFRHQLGLPAVNKTAGSSLNFDEPEETYLTLAGGGTITINGSGSGPIKIDAGSTATDIIVNGSGTTSERGNPPVMLKANHASSTLAVSGGSVGLGTEPLSSGQVASVIVSGNSSPSVEVGSGITVAAYNVSSGTLVSNAAVTTVLCTAGVVRQLAGAITTANIFGGTLAQQGTGTISTLSISSGGTLDCSQDGRARTVTNCAAYGRTSIKDPLGSVTFTNGIDMYAKPAEVVLDLPANKTYSISAI